MHTLLYVNKNLEVKGCMCPHGRKSCVFHAGG